MLLKKKTFNNSNLSLESISQQKKWHRLIDKYRNSEYFSENEIEKKLEIRKRVLNCVVMLVLLFGSENWTVSSWVDLNQLRDNYFNEYWEYPRQSM